MSATVAHRGPPTDHALTKIECINPVHHQKAHKNTAHIFNFCSDTTSNLAVGADSINPVESRCRKTQKHLKYPQKTVQQHAANMCILQKQQNTIPSPPGTDTEQFDVQWIQKTTALGITIDHEVKP